jgi:hypothetical protein
MKEWLPTIGPTAVILVGILYNNQRLNRLEDQIAKLAERVSMFEAEIRTSIADLRVEIAELRGERRSDTREKKPA